MRGTEWSCRVFLRRATTSNGQSTFGQIKEPFGDTITDKDLLESLVLRAQLAILNPNFASETFLYPNVDLNHPSELSFTPNIVCLEITGPDYTDISFVDLPGTSPKFILQDTFSDGHHRLDSQRGHRWKPGEHPAYRGFGFKLYFEGKLHHPYDHHL